MPIDNLDQPVAAKLSGLLAASLTGNEDAGGALCRAPHSTRPVPLGDPRSSILRDPAAHRFPEMPLWSPRNGFRAPHGSMNPPLRP